MSTTRRKINPDIIAAIKQIHDDELLEAALNSGYIVAVVVRANGRDITLSRELVRALHKMFR